MIETHQAGFQAGGRWLVRGLDLCLEAGCFTAILGANGAGKSTLLRLLAGEVEPSAGQVSLAGRPVHRMATAELARHRAVLLQRRPSDLFPYTALELVLLGRLPHGDGDQPESLALAQRMLARVDALHLADRLYATLSGGEAVRVDLARLLVQDTPLLLLDEPMAHLDPAHQLLVGELCRQLAREGRCVVAVLHDLNLAAWYADRALLLHEGRCLRVGPIGDVLAPDALQVAYGIALQRQLLPDGRTVLVPVPPH